MSMPPGRAKLLLFARTPMPNPNVKPVTPADASAAVDTIMLAFAADPMARWCWPDPHQYVAIMPDFTRAFASAGFARGAFYTEGNVGAALWLPPGAEPDEAAMGEMMERTIAAATRGEAMAVMEQMASHHPEGPHWYLPLIGVDPAHQGKGHGDALMRHVLAICDREHLPAYLESTNPRNISLYKRHGFVEITAIQLGSSPTVVPMLRAAR
jgi:ribosomal protein S18 acetylase RimI-like enzyme